MRGPNELLAAAELADGFCARLVGLMFRRALQPDQAMCLADCHQVHTIGMRFAIDIVFVDGDSVIVQLVHNLVPNRLASCAAASHAIEFAAGGARHWQLAVGQCLRWQSVPPADSGQAQITGSQVSERLR